jgi:hypothetical protein
MRPGVGVIEGRLGVHLPVRQEVHPPAHPVFHQPAHPSTGRRHGDPACHAVSTRSSDADISTTRQPRGAGSSFDPAGSPASIALGATTIASAPARQRQPFRAAATRRHRRSRLGGQISPARPCPYMERRPRMSRLISAVSDERHRLVQVRTPGRPGKAPA